jgi:hypothetical protein
MSTEPWTAFPALPYAGAGDALRRPAALPPVEVMDLLEAIAARSEGDFWPEVTAVVIDGGVELLIGGEVAAVIPLAPRGPITKDDIEAARTPAGGWTAATLAGWGVPWPPPKGWQDDLIARDADRFWNWPLGGA